MSKIVLLAVLAAWAAVLIPPLLRSRVENRPNSSVTDFRRQLSTLQRAVPTRTMVPMRSMGRPLASPSPLSRPAAQGRPGQPHQMHRAAAPAVAGQRMHNVTLDRTNGQHRQAHLHKVSQREMVRRTRPRLARVARARFRGGPSNNRVGQSRYPRCRSQIPVGVVLRQGPALLRPWPPCR